MFCSLTSPVGARPSRSGCRELLRKRWLPVLPHRHEAGLLKLGYVEDKALARLRIVPGRAHPPSACRNCRKCRNRAHRILRNDAILRALRLACLGMGIFNPNRRLCDGCHILKPTAALFLDLPRYCAPMVQSKEISMCIVSMIRNFVHSATACRCTCGGCKCGEGGQCACRCGKCCCRA